MAKPILMPQIGVSDETAILAEWHVAVGDSVEVGQLLFTLETDKSTFEVAADQACTVLAFLCEQGDEVAVASPVCVVGDRGESFDASEFTAASPPESPGSAASAPERTAEARAETPLTAGGSAADKASVSPRAKATAAKLGLDPSLATPTGAEGRIIERDVLAIDTHAVRSTAKPNAPEVTALKPADSQAAEFTDVPHSRIRRTIAKNMLHSTQSIPQLTHHHSFDATALLALRAKCKCASDARVSGVTIGDLVLYAVSRTLKAHANLNSNYYDDYLRVFGSVNLGVAVDTPRGLMVPTIFGASELSAAEISAQLKTLAAECRSGSVDPSKLGGASFTVSNLGAYGVESFTPVINPPQSAILGVCATVNRVRTDGSVYPAMGLSLTYDHRAVDGAPASMFLRDLCANLENIETLMVSG
ncbi:MAG: 2-oxo acid dehydrogenase subunit E2 [Oscillospiraceae bacterium]|jgi:pyruvate dehydrogenase E2 component (dihydrolipoamide acetyltransferase)|nr:2-oxo acid dehydrogenase subunit E2 [Oscillospiraceae bacterium]